MSIGGAALVSFAVGCQFQSSGTVTDDVVDDSFDLVEDDAPPPAPDAPGVPDADPAAPDAVPGFDPARDCPASYAPEVLGGSRYRYFPADLIPPDDGNFGWDVFAADCNDDAPGLTHLGVPDVDGEIARWDDVIGSATYAYRFTWFGVSRDAGESTWHDVLGAPFDPTTLRLFVGEPNASTNTRAALWYEPSTNYVFDDPADYEYMAVCECDGKPPID